MTSEQSSEPVVPDRVPLAAGTTLRRGKYRIRRPIGAGGYAITYLATQSNWDWNVAIKEFFPVGCYREHQQVCFGNSMTAQEYADSLAGFLQEAQLLERFVHHGVVRVLDYFEEGNSAYLVEEFLDGFSLLSGLEKAGRMSWRRVQLMLHQIGFGLKLVHSAGLVHSDIKPDNIFLCRDGRYVLIDFGLSRGFLSRKASESGARGVSPGYSPPEQYRRGQRLGPEADVYALAATAYHLLTGIEPPDSLERLKGATLPSLIDLSTPLSNQVQDALLMAVDPDPECRTKTMDDFLRQLGLDVSAKSTPYKPAHFGLVKRKSAHRTGVTCLAFSPATQVLASGGKDGFVRIWDWPSLEMRGQVHGHEHPVSTLSFASDGSFLLSGSESGQIAFWDANLNEHSQRHLLNVAGPGGPAFAGPRSGGRLCCHFHRWNLLVVWTWTGIAKAVFGSSGRGQWTGRPSHWRLSGHRWRRRKDSCLVGARSESGDGVGGTRQVDSQRPVSRRRTACAKFVHRHVGAAVEPGQRGVPSDFQGPSSGGLGG